MVRASLERAAFLELICPTGPLGGGTFAVEANELRGAAAHALDRML